MKHFSFFLLLLIASIPCVSFAQARPETGDDEKIALIREMFETTGAINLGRQMMARMVEAEKQGKTKEEQKKIDLLASRMDPAELIDETVEIYDRHFTKDEIAQILVFYKSDVGAKLLRETPALLQEGMNLGEKWANQKSTELRQDLNTGTTLQ